jgi:hypothetical protein
MVSKIIFFRLNPLADLRELRQNPGALTATTCLDNWHPIRRG